RPGGAPRVARPRCRAGESLMKMFMHNAAQGTSTRHPSEGWGPATLTTPQRRWVPAFAGMTVVVRSTLLATAIALAGCASIGPDYHAEKIAAPQLQGLDAAQESNAQFQAAWWKQFNDPTLDALIQRAAANNLDLRIAVARLHESRALLSGAKSDRLPTIDTG